jgi:hypothetical protein
LVAVEAKCSEYLPMSSIYLFLINIKMFCDVEKASNVDPFNGYLCSYVMASGVEKM